MLHLQNKDSIFKVTGGANHNKLRLMLVCREREREREVQ